MLKGKAPETKRKRTPEQTEFLEDVRRYRAHVKMRVAIGNQLFAMARRNLYTPDEVKAYQDRYLPPMKREEDRIIKAMIPRLEGIPIWERWLKHVRGIGDRLSVQLIAYIQPVGDFPTVVHLWSYAGFAVTEDGEAVRRQIGKQSRWNADLKTLTILTAETFIKCGGKFREVYDRYRARDEAAHPEPMRKLDAKGKPMNTRSGEPWMLYTKGHMYARARRYCGKIFLAMLWQAWREIEGLPVRGPYAVEYLGHTMVLSPWTFVEQSEEIEEPCAG